MIPFFRKIRKKLADENSFLKYSRYAIGEIVLVMVGILLALQVNNWNENRKAKIAEHDLFIKIVNDLELDAIKTQKYVKDLNEHQSTHYQIYKEIQGSSQYDSSIPYQNLRWHIPFSLIVSANHSEKSVNIKNDKISELIEAYFKSEALVKEALTSYNNYKFDYLRPSFSRHGIHSTDAVFSKPPFKFEDVSEQNVINYPKLKAQYGTVELDQLLFNLGVKASWAISILEAYLDDNENLKQALVNELDLKK